MWIELDKANVCELSYLAAVGRALALGQRFEFTCKRILSVLNIAKSIRDRDSVDLDYWGKHMDEFVEDRLADAIRKYGTIHNISIEKVSLLVKARQARNYIAHEAALLWFGIPSKSVNMSSIISKLREVSVDLAAGHNLVSEWGYSIEEKEPPPFRMITTYEAIVVEWIMEPIINQLGTHLSHEINGN